MSENNLSDIISALSSNKEILKLAEKAKQSGDFGSIFNEVASLLGDSSGNKNEAESTIDKESEKDAFAEKESDESNSDTKSSEQNTLLGSLLPLFSSSVSENAELLIALKPYLSKKRCDLIDSIIKISKLASIVSLQK